jgi:hypothetical protein
MVKWKRQRTNNDPFFIWPLYCLLWVNICTFSFSFDHCIVCYGSMFVICLFHLTIALSVMGQRMKKKNDKHWPITDNTMVIWKRQRTNIDPLQKIQWSNEKEKGITLTHNRQYSLSFVFFIWPLYYLLRVNVCRFSFLFDHCIVCYGSLFVLCLFHLTIVLSVMGQCLSFFLKKKKDKHWPITDNTMVKWKRQRTNIDP